MSENNNDSSRTEGKKGNKLALLAGVLALGVLAVALSASLLVGQAGAQSNDLSRTVTDTPNNSGVSSQTAGSQPALANTGNTYAAPVPTISTRGSATQKVQPDKFSITLGVDTNGATAEEASSKNADAMTKVLAALKDIGIRDDQIGTTNFSVNPVYNYDQSAKPCPQDGPAILCPPSQVITGYTASNSVTVTLDAQGNIDAGKVIDTAVKAGANNVFGVNFFTSTPKQESIRNSLIEQAIADARSRADIAASAVGMQVTGVQSISLDDVSFPIYSKSYDLSPMASGAASATPIQPGQQDVSTSVSLVFTFASENSSGVTPSGATATRGNTNCTNPPNGPMIC